MASPYKIHLAAYDGPLDLLLDLIRKQEMDIHNIPISTITGQYLEYLHKLEELDIDVSADFIYMAATLILIKSKMLLPPDPLAGPEDQGDPRAELVYRLVEHEKFKNAAQLLFERQQLEAHVWSKPDLSLYEGEDVEGELVVSLVDLVRVFQQVLERRKEVTRIELKHDQFTVAQMMEVLRGQLLASEDGVELVGFFESCPARSAMICALLAVLELVRLQAVVLAQSELFGPIMLRKHKMFDVFFSGGGERGQALAEATADSSGNAVTATGAESSAEFAETQENPGAAEVTGEAGDELNQESDQ
jgi:segregation and condensation protein A